MSKKCKAYSVSKIGLGSCDSRTAFYAGWESALRDALDAAHQPAAVGQEPVAHLYCGGQFGNELDEWEIDPEQYQCDKLNERFGALGKRARIPLYTAPQPAAVGQEPVLTVGFDAQCWRKVVDALKALPDGALLYTAPQPAHPPLTDEKIDNMVVTASLAERDMFRRLARAVERAHGIGGEA